MARQLTVIPRSGALGAQVTGVSLKEDLAPGTARELRRLLLDYLILAFPEQFLSPDEHRAFARSFGELERHPEVVKVLEGTDQEVVVIEERYGVSNVWHFDYDVDFVPSGLGTLNMRCCPARGGDTIFVNSHLLYEHLSGPMRELLDGLTAVHHNIGNTGRNRDVAEHPLVGVHPETGRKGLLFSGHHVTRFVEMSEAESELLIGYLRALSMRPEFSYRHRWAPGDLCLWDNRCIQHYAVNDFEQPRLLHRVTMRAELPRAVSPGRWPPHRDQKFHWRPDP